MNTLYFLVPGNPQGKERPRFTRNGHIVYTPSTTVAYEKLIRSFARRSIPKDWDPCGAYQVHIQAFFGIPKSWPKWKQEAAAMGLIPHTSKPDRDNIDKVVCDALNGLVWTDDSKTYYGQVVKMYTDKEPCVEVTVWHEPIFTREDWLKMKGGDK